jgi:peptidoglycan/xylan/chitin deacetylase (PgdA/CDA1 family)
MSATVLMYHMVDAPQNGMEARFCRTPQRFRADMQHLADAGYTVLSLASLRECVNGRRPWPHKSAAITFDDGIACDYEQALPILRDFDFPATFFVVTGLIDGHNDWAIDHGFARRRMLSASELRELDRAGMDVGSHTVRHRMLAKTTAEEAREELRGSKARLEDLLGRPVLHFAYPYGSWKPEVKTAVIEAGYALACSTSPGKVRTADDPFLLRRIEIKGGDSPLQFKLKLRFGTQDMPPVSDLRRAARRRLENWGLLAPRAH